MGRPPTQVRRHTVARLLSLRHLKGVAGDQWRPRSDGEAQARAPVAPIDSSRPQVLGGKWEEPRDDGTPTETYLLISSLSSGGRLAPVRAFNGMSKRGDGVGAPFKSSRCPCGRCLPKGASGTPQPWDGRAAPPRQLAAATHPPWPAGRAAQ